MSAVLSVVLGLYVGHAGVLDSVSAQLAQEEVKRLLAPAGIELVWNAQDQEVALAVVVSFEGSCSVDVLPRAGSLQPDAGPLGQTALSSTRVLPYFKLDCSRLIQALTPVLQRLNMPLRRAVLGQAVGRVMAHEIYHVISQRKDHDDGGAAKACFSLHDLTAREFNFNRVTLERMRPIRLLATTR